MNTLPETTFEPTFTTGKLAFGSAATVDTEFLSFDLSDDEQELEISNRCDHLNTSNRYNKTSFGIKKATPQNCEGIKTRISPSRTKSGDTRRKPKGRRRTGRDD